jgi:hypothetical protein
MGRELLIKLALKLFKIHMSTVQEKSSRSNLITIGFFKNILLSNGYRIKFINTQFRK